MAVLDFGVLYVLGDTLKLRLPGELFKILIYVPGFIILIVSYRGLSINIYQCNIGKHNPYTDKIISNTKDKMSTLNNFPVQSPNYKDIFCYGSCGTHEFTYKNSYLGKIS